MFENYLPSKSILLWCQLWRVTYFYGNRFALKTMTILIPNKASYFTPLLAMVGCKTRGQRPRVALGSGLSVPISIQARYGAHRSWGSAGTKDPFWRTLYGLASWIQWLCEWFWWPYLMFRGSRAVSALGKVLGLPVTLLAASKPCLKKGRLNVNRFFWIFWQSSLLFNFISFPAGPGVWDNFTHVLSFFLSLISREEQNKV